MKKNYEIPSGSFLVGQGSDLEVLLPCSDMGDIDTIEQKYLRYERSKSLYMCRGYAFI